MPTNIKAAKVVRSISRWMDTEIKKGTANFPIEQVIQWRDALTIAANNLDAENCETCRIDVIGFDRLNAEMANELRLKIINAFVAFVPIAFQRFEKHDAESFLGMVSSAIEGIYLLTNGVARAAPQTPTKTN